jgi:hypothetical protein
MCEESLLAFSYSSFHICKVQSDLKFQFIYLEFFEISLFFFVCLTRVGFCFSKNSSMFLLIFLYCFLLLNFVSALYYFFLLLLVSFCLYLLDSWSRSLDYWLETFHFSKVNSAINFLLATVLIVSHLIGYFNFLSVK